MNLDAFYKIVAAKIVFCIFFIILFSFNTHIQISLCLDYFETYLTSLASCLVITTTIALS